MRLATLRHEGRNHAAFLHGDSAYLVDDVAQIASSRPLPASESAGQLIASNAFPDHAVALFERLPALVDGGDLVAHPAAGALGPPVLRPGKIICVGRNYAAHARETGSDIPTRPILFAKFASAVIGPYDDIVRPREVTDLDYEAELCVVIGQRTRRVAVSDALNHVAGYCCANDVSARTAQLGMGDQWLRGKSFDTFCPIGPAIVTRDEIPDPQRLHIETRVDGEIRQDDTTAGMTFDVATLVSYCSDAFSLEPGDLLLTGTPPGVALGRTPPPWLQPGQLCEVEIEGLGRLANRIVQEPDGSG